MIGRPSRRLLRGRLGPVRLLASLLAVLALVACVRVDPWMRDACVAALPALEEGGGPITVLAVEPLGERGTAIRLRYRAGAGIGAHDHEIACAFAHDESEGGRRDLVGIRTEQGLLPTSRLFFLRRFWLADPDLREAGLARVAFAPGARPHGLATLDATTGLRLQQGLDALAPASLYALLGLSCALVFGLVGRILVFFGDLAMLGAFAALTAAVAVVGTEAADPLVLVPVTVLAAAAAVAVWGGEIGRAVVAPLAFRAPTPLLVAAVGLSTALQEFAARARGVRDLWLPPPVGAPLLVTGGSFEVFVTPMRLVLVAVVASVVAAVVWVFPRTRFGRAWRAVADDAGMASLLGVDPRRVTILTLALAGALAGIAGAVHALAWGGTSFHMGTVLGVKAVIVALMGGAGSLAGAALAGVALGFVEAGWTAVWGADWRDVAVFALLVAVLLWRRDGLLGAASRA